MIERRPFIYLYGVAPNLYEPIFPCYVVEDQPDELGFRVAADAAGARIGPHVSADLDRAAPRRQYATAAVKVRLHQRRFRELVLPDYQVRCAVCRLKPPRGLRCEHPGRGTRLRRAHPAGRAGGARRADVDARLEEMDGQRILVPRAASLRPKEEYLEERYGRFRAA